MTVNLYGTNPGDPDYLHPTKPADPCGQGTQKLHNEGKHVTGLRFNSQHGVT